MNETIGVKGGKNDLRRRLIITKKAKEKLLKSHQEQKNQELKKLEQKVKQQQLLTLIATVPIAAIGQVYTVLTEDKEKEKQLAIEEAISLLKKENIFSEKDTEKIISALKEGTIFQLDQDLLKTLGLSFEINKQKDVSELSEPILQDNNSNQASFETKDAVLKVVELTLEEKQQNLLSKDQREKHQELETFTHQEKRHSKVEDLDSLDDKLDKLKNHKIVDEYEKKLKEVRTDLRQLVFEYNLVSEASDHIDDSKEAEALLERLNEIIKKIEELKTRINVPDIDKYDDNYLYTLVEDYISEFKNKKFVTEIKDSALYIMISEKLDELDTKKDLLNEKIEAKKTSLEITEMRLEQVRSNYFSYEKFSKDLLKFQASQDEILNEIREKMAKATTIQERVEVQVVGMQRQSRRLLTMLGASMMMPGLRSARGFATMTATYLYFMRNIMQPKTVTRRYKTIKVEDYSKDIEKSLSELDNVSSLLNKTSNQINRTIQDFEKEFAEYLDVIPECRKLLADLEKIKEELATKEYELAQLKLSQEKNLEKNDSKVKRMTYEVAV